MEDSVFELDVPETVCFTLLELDSGLFEVCDAVDELSPPVVGD